MPDKYQRSSGYQLLMLILSVLSVTVVAAEFSGRLRPTTAQILKFTDLGFCVMFLFDFGLQLYRAPDRKKYFFTWGWIDLLSSIPTFDLTRFGRVARVFRIFRIVRGIRAARLIHGVWEHRAENALLAATIAAIILVTGASILVLLFETNPDSNIKTAEDAVWWAMTTITTVGYGDRFPITDGGRIIATFLMAAGVGLFGTFSAFLASWFLGEKSEDRTRKEIVAMREEINGLRNDIRALSDTRKS
jgi:voltage-gated potassium channel